MMYTLQKFLNLFLLSSFFLGVPKISYAQEVACESLYARLAETHFLKQAVNSYQELPKNLLHTSGIEVEATVPATLGVKGVAEAAEVLLKKKYGNVKKVFNWDYLENGYHRRNYKLIYKKNGEEQTFTFTEDLTVVPEVSRRPIEFVSPILHDDSDYQDFLDVLSLGKKLGARAEPNTAGIHFHNGFPNPQTGELAVLAVATKRLESELFDLAQVSQPRKPFARPMLQELEKEVESGEILAKSPNEILESFFPGPDGRYRALNLHSLKKHGTIENRVLNSSLDPRIITLFHDFFTALTTAVREKNPKLLEVLSRSDEQTSMRDISTAIGISSDRLDFVAGLIRDEHNANKKSSVKLLLNKAAQLPRVTWQNRIAPSLGFKSAPKGWQDGQHPLPLAKLFGRSDAERRFKEQGLMIEAAQDSDLVPIEWIFNPYYVPLGHTSIRAGNIIYEMTSKGMRIHGEGGDNARAFLYNNPFFKAQYAKYAEKGMPPASFGIETKVKKSDLKEFIRRSNNYKSEYNKGFSLLFNNCNQSILEIFKDAGVNIPANRAGYAGFSSALTFKRLLNNPDFKKDNINLYPLAGTGVEVSEEVIPKYLYDDSSVGKEILRVIREWPRGN